MRAQIKLTGVSPMVMHNIRLADPTDPIVKEIAAITAKPSSKRTESENAEIERLEWLGGIYHEPDMGIYCPTWNVIRCLEEAGKVTRSGKAIIRAANIVIDKVPVVHEGPKDLKAMYALPEYRFRSMVRLQQNKIPRMRPIFRRWSLSMEVELLEDVMSLADLRTIAELAGRAEGLNDARKLGYGRFQAEVTT